MSATATRTDARWPLVLAGALPAVAAAAAAVLYDSPLLMLLVMAAAAVAGAAPVGLSRNRPAAAGPAAVFALIVLVGALLVLVNGEISAADGVRELSGALARLLSFEPPIPTRLDTLVPPVVVVWAASFVAAACAVRGRRLLSAAPAALVLIAALLLVGRAAPVPGWVAPALALGAAVLLLGDLGSAARGARGGRRGTGGSGGLAGRGGVGRAGGILGALIAVVLIAVGLVSSEAIPSQGRVDARAHYQPPVQRPEPVDPLTRLAGWAKGDSEVLATVRVAPPVSTVTAWRWAVLDQFDGARWTSSLAYRPTGKRLRDSPGQPGASAAGAGPTVTVRAGLQVSPTLEPWLPTPGVVHEVTGLGVAVNPEHDSIVQAVPSGSSQTYGLVADGGSLDPTKAVDRAEISTFMVGAGGGTEAADARSVPGLPANLRSIADGFTPNPGTTDGARALRLQDVLRKGQFAADAPPGNLYVRLTQFFDDQTAAYLKGTSEQFATAFAVLARAVGLPCRIVVGFQLPTGQAGSMTGSGTVAGSGTVTGSDMSAWPEVYFSGHGWVRFAPTPKNLGASANRTPPKLKDLIPQAQQPATPVPAQLGGSGGHKKVKAPAGRGQGFPVVPVVATVLLVLLALAVLLLLISFVLRRRLRSARRRGADPALRVIGAWRELEDAVVLAGVGAGAGRGTGSAAEVVELVQHRTGAAQAPLTELARIANAAAFGPDGTIRPQEVDRAWQISDETTTDLRRSASRARRWRWWVRIGPLRRR